MSIFPNLSREQLELRLAEAYRRERYLNDEVKELSCRVLKRFSNEECWIYAEGEDNFLESLVCPVVISAEQARAFEAAVSLSYVYRIRGRCDQTLEACDQILKRFPNAKDLVPIYFPKALGIQNGHSNRNSSS